jgi:hypothetical protein
MPMGLRNICASCAEKKEGDYLKVREFVKDHPKVSIEVVAEATGVPETKVRQFLREGLIEAADLEGSPLTCQRCGKPIMRGAYCAICQLEFASGKAETKDYYKEDKSKGNSRVSLVHDLKKGTKKW